MRRRKFGWTLAAVFLAWQGLLLAQDWEKWEHCVFHEGSHSDGDSVEVLRGGRRHVFRLYFVDCLERNPASSARRAEQARYFGLDEPSESAALRAAYLASDLTKRALSQPFTVYTRWQRVNPDNGNPAVRAFIRTAEGEDLAMLLVSQGLAIIRHGKSAVSDDPDGQSAAEISSNLRKAERQARAMKRGAWGLRGAVVDSGSPAELTATDRDALAAQAGTKLRVRGRVSSVGRLPGRMTFINFDHERGGFVGIVREKFAARFSKRFPKGLRNELTGKEVTLEGRISLYRGTPQIELETPDQIRLLP